MMDINFILLVIGLILIVSILLTKFSSRLGVPILLIFLFFGIFFNSDMFIADNVYNYSIVQSISIFALIVIMFSGGLDTDFDQIRSVSKEGVSLATVGVMLTAFITGLLVYYLLHLDFALSILLGSMVSSTDAAAVFSIFKSQKFHIKNNLDYMLEVESGTNDPIAYILVISSIHLILNPQTALIDILFEFVWSLSVGLIFGYVMGKIFAKLLTIIKLPIEGLYPVLLLSIAILSFAVTEFFSGNGFLSVYMAAVIIGNSKIKYKYTQLSFFEGIAWLMQIVMFILLGAFTQPGELALVFVPAILISVLLIFVSRPIAVLVSLAPFNMDWKSKAFISWAGVKGAIPIVFAFYPLVAGIGNANLLFNVVMVITCISVLVQGSTIKIMAKKLGLLFD